MSRLFPVAIPNLTLSGVQFQMGGGAFANVRLLNINGSEGSWN